jgi:hypothetical protein
MAQTAGPDLNDLARTTSGPRRTASLGQKES